MTPFLDSDWSIDSDLCFKDEWGVEECAKCPFELGDGLEVVDKAEDYIHEDERLCTDLDDDQCRFTFVYGYNNKTGQLQVRFRKRNV